MFVWPDAIDPLGEAGIEVLAAEIRRRLGPTPEASDSPLVSIVVLNRDGADQLRRLLRGLVERTDYTNFELVVVDNGSTDESLDLLRTIETPFPISIVSNPHNETFADANNQGAELASGELVLFVNNDVEPIEPGWLWELIVCLREERVGIAGATLVFPKRGAAHGYLVQHRAMHFRDSPGFPQADLRGHGEEPFADGFGEDADTPIPTGACMLMPRELFRRIGGFTHGYVYGGEDLDLALKVLALGYRVRCSGRSLLIHRFSATRGRRKREEWRRVGLGNQRLLRELWGARLRREYELDRLAGGGQWAATGQAAPADSPSREQILALGFCLKSSDPPAAFGDADPLKPLQAELRRRGHRYTILREEAVDDAAGFDYDVAVHMRGSARYVPASSQLNVLWAVGRFDSLTAIECDRYDLVLSGDPALSERLLEGKPMAPVVTLTGESHAEKLVDAVLARADRLAFPTLISPQVRRKPGRDE